MARFLSIFMVALAGAAVLPATGRAEFGLHDFDVSFREVDGTPASQAGSHPFVFETALALNLEGDEPDEKLRHLLVDFPPGVVANTTAYPRCTDSGFNELKDGMNGCPLGTAVGISASSFGEPGHWITAPIFNLVPAEGALLSLGFRVADAANVVIDVSLSPNPPFNPLAAVREVPESVDLFGAKLQLWGDPASVAHDELRGACGVYAATLPSGDISEFEFEGSGKSCPVQLSPIPFLTLPTSCDGPLSTFYEAISWGGDEDFGEALTHDGSGQPQGLTSCGQLNFRPQAEAELTTDATAGPTGLDFTLAFQDEGLTSVEGIAESQVREIALVLPEGVAAGSALTSGVGACSQASFASETLDSLSGGCPEASRIGTVEVESPLLEEPVEGTVYRALPFENLAEDSPMAMYLVLRNVDLGIIVKQVVGIETDPETGQLIAFSEEIPQLPFSRLQLHLDADEGTLVSPPRCGKYETEAELVPWSDDLVFISSSAFEIVSGPNGGPCPVDGANPGVGGVGQTPSPSAGPSSPGSAPRGSHAGAHKRTCPKGKRRVRRKGRVRCVKRGPKKSKDGRGRRAGSRR